MPRPRAKPRPTRQRAGDRSPGAALPKDLAVALTELKARLADHLGQGFDSLVLFGSRARGDWHAGSDVDLALIVRSLDSKSRDEVLDLVADVELKYDQPLSILVLSTEQLATLRQRERRLAQDIDHEGVRL